MLTIALRTLVCKKLTLAVNSFRGVVFFTPSPFIFQVMGFSFTRPKEVPSFNSRSEAFDYLFADLVERGRDMMEAAEQAEKFASIVAKNKKLPDVPPKELNGLEKGIGYIKQMAELKKENPEIWEMVTGALSGVIGGFSGGSVTIEEPKVKDIDFESLE